MRNFGSKKTLFFISFLSISFVFLNFTTVNAACNWRYQKYTGTAPSGCNENEHEEDQSAKDAEKCSGNKLVAYQICCCTNPIESAGTTASQKKENTEALFTIPDFQVKIPGMNKLATITCELGKECNIPWIGQYIAGIYNYAIAIAGILAALVLMAGGVLWLVSAGDASRITQAKELIIGSVSGLIILVASYVLLIQINPDLVNLKSISITSIKNIEIYPDADITVVGGTSAYTDGCTASKKNDWSVCKAYGEAQPPDLVSIENVKVNASVAQRYQAAMECVKQKNGKTLFKIKEAWRSPATQIKYKEKAIAEGHPGSAADPCCSNHGAGQALDINMLNGTMSWDYNTSSGLEACMNAQQLYANITTGGTNGKGEPWHWSPTGR